MKTIIVLTIVLSTFLYASQSKENSITKSEVQKQIEREKKYAKEQTFYQGEAYGLESFEVNPESVKNIKLLEVDDTGDDMIDMD